MWWKDDKENSYFINKKIKLKGKRKNETNSPEIRLLLLCRVSNGTMEPDKARCFLITKHRRSMHTLSHSCIFCSKLLACVLLTSFVFHYTVNMYKASFLGSRYRLFSNFDNLPRTVTSLHYILDLIYIYMYVGTNTYIYGNPNRRANLEDWLAESYRTETIKSRIVHRSPSPDVAVSCLVNDMQRCFLIWINDGERIRVT